MSPGEPLSARLVRVGRPLREDQPAHPVRGVADGTPDPGRAEEPFRQGMAQELALRDVPAR